MPLPKSYPVILPKGAHIATIKSAVEGETSTQKKYVRVTYDLEDLEADDIEQMFWVDNAGAMQRLTALYETVIPPSQKKNNDNLMYPGRLEGRKVVLNLYVTKKDGIQKNGIISVKPLVKIEKV